MAARRRDVVWRRRLSPGPDDPGPAKKRKKDLQSPSLPLEVLAPRPFLALLPDNVLLCIMSLLDVLSVLCLSRVCRRFHFLSRDHAVWRHVDLTTVGQKLDARRLKKVIKERFFSGVRSVWLASNASACLRRSNLRPVLTSAVLDGLFESCQYLQTISLNNCDITQFPMNCRLFHCDSLKRVELCHCVTNLRWMEVNHPLWPSLTHLSLAFSVKTSDADLNVMASSKPWASNLRSLVLAGCYRITDAGVQKVCESWKGLLVLDISECVGLTYQVLSSVAKLSHLKTLSLAKLKFLLQVSLEQVSQHFPKTLTTLNVRGTGLRASDLASGLSVDCRVKD